MNAPERAAWESALAARAARTGRDRDRKEGTAWHGGKWPGDLSAQMTSDDGPPAVLNRHHRRYAARYLTSPEGVLHDA